MLPQQYAGSPACRSGVPTRGLRPQIAARAAGKSSPDRRTWKRQTLDHTFLITSVSPAAFRAHIAERVIKKMYRPAIAPVKPDGPNPRRGRPGPLLDLVGDQREPTFSSASPGHPEPPWPLSRPPTRSASCLAASRASRFRPAPLRDAAARLPRRFLPWPCRARCRTLLTKPIAHLVRLEPLDDRGRLRVRMLFGEVTDELGFVLLRAGHGRSPGGALITDCCNCSSDHAAGQWGMRHIRDGRGA